MLLRLGFKQHIVAISKKELKLYKVEVRHELESIKKCGFDPIFASSIT